jgi:Ca2+-binding RTX toxin-like protein
MMTFIKRLGQQLIKSRGAAASKRRSFRPGLETLENRLVPTFVVTGTNDPDKFTISYVTDADGNQHFSVRRETGGFVPPALNAAPGEDVAIETRDGDDAIFLNLPPSIPGGLKVHINASFGNDSVHNVKKDPASNQPDTNYLWKITGPKDVTVNGYIQLWGVDTLVGRGASTLEGYRILGDWFEMSPGVSFDGRIDGGSAPGALLSYEAWTTDVHVGQGMATGVAGGIANINAITGGSGNDTIYGNARNNILRGGPGNDVIHAGDGNDVVLGGPGDDDLYGGRAHDLIIGGIGADDLFGGPDEGRDILIGGSTAYDSYDGWLLHIVDTWVSNSYETAIAKLRSSTTIESPLNNSTVYRDTLAKGSTNRDNLQGQGGLDWFWADPTEVQRTWWGSTVIKGDNILDLQTGEVNG